MHFAADVSTMVSRPKSDGSFLTGAVAGGTVGLVGGPIGVAAGALIGGVLGASATSGAARAMQMKPPAMTVDQRDTTTVDYPVNDDDYDVERNDDTWTCYEPDNLGGIAFADYGAVTYTVRAGDTLTKIAISQGLCSQPAGSSRSAWQPCINAANALAVTNNISNPDSLVPGQVIVLSQDVDRPPLVILPSTAGTTVGARAGGADSGGTAWALGLAAVAAGAFWFSGGKRRRPSTARGHSKRRRR
jgi:hypothetical protein